MSDHVIIVGMICITIIIIVYIFKESISELVKKIKNIDIKRKNTIQETKLKISTDETVELNIKNTVLENNIIENDEVLNSDIIDVFELLRSQKEDEAEKLFKVVIQNEKDLEKKERMNFFYDYYIYVYGIKLDYNDLENKYIKSNNSNDFKALIYRKLSELEEKYGKLIKAIEYIEKSIEIGTTTDENPIDVVTRLRLLRENKSEYNLQKIIEEYDNSDSSKKQKYKFFKALSELYIKDEKYSLILLEYGTQYVLNDCDALFHLAYTIKDEEKSLYYYKKVLDLNENFITAKNNIGVCCQNLEMKIKAVKYYKEAKKSGMTLAGSNLGLKLLNAGFVDEVTEIIKWARGCGEYDENIDSLQTSLNENIKKENEKFNKYIENAKIKNRFLDETGIYYINKNIISMRGLWKADDNLSFEISGKENGKVNLKLTKSNTLYASDNVNINDSNIINMSSKNYPYPLAGEVTVTIVAKNKDLILLIEKEDKLPEIKNLSFCDNL